MKWPAQERNVLSKPGLEPRPLNPESSTLTTGPPIRRVDQLEILQMKGKSSIYQFYQTALFTVTGFISVYKFCLHYTTNNTVV